MKAIIFDMDGVIFNTENLWKEAFQYYTKRYNLPLDETYRASICGKSEELIIEELKDMFPSLDGKKYRDEIGQYYLNKINEVAYIVKEGFFELIKNAKEKGYKLALATSNTKMRMEKLFSQKDIDPYQIFDVITTVEEVGAKSKPDPYIFLITAKKIGYQSEDIFVIEDSLNGIEAAVRGGFVPIMIKDLIEPNQLAKEKCRLLTDTLLDIIPII